MVPIVCWSRRLESAKQLGQLLYIPISAVAPKASWHRPEGLHQGPSLAILSYCAQAFTAPLEIAPSR